MDFLLFLTPVGNQILNDLISAKFYVYENKGPCLSGKIFGYFKPPHSLYVCTKNIVNLGYDPYTYVNETVYHESVHAVHECRRKKSFGIRTAIGLSQDEMYLSPEKWKDVRNSTAYAGSRVLLEQEAYYLEDKPQRVSNYIRKFCF